MKTLMKNILTGKDNETHDIARHSWLVSLVGVFAFAAVNAYHGLAINLAEFSQAIGAIVLAHGGAIFAKAKTEPDTK